MAGRALSPLRGRARVLKSRVILSGNEIVAIFPYVARQVAAIKQVPGAKWDRLARVWRVPITSLALMRKFAQQFSFDVDDNLTGFDLPSHSVGPPRVERGAALFLHFPYDPVLVKAVTQIPGARWGTTRHCWIAPLASIESVLQFADRFGLVVVDDSLYLLQQETQRQLAALNALSCAEDADIEVAGLVGELKPFQRAGVAYASIVKKCFIADQMGLGKTVQALATLEYLHEQGEAPFPAVIVCPPSLVLNWQAEMRKFIPHRTISVVTGRKEFPGPADYTVVGWSNIHVWTRRLTGFGAYIFDESHAAKNPKAKRTAAAIKMALKAPVVLLLTGTPVKSRPAEYVSQLEVIGQLTQFGGKWPFLMRYTGAFKDQRGNWNLKGAANLEELNRILRSTCYIRRTKAQVLKDLKPIEMAVLRVAPDPIVMREYNAAVADIASFMAERAAQIAMELGESPHSAAVIARIKAESNEHLVRIAALRRLVGLAKLDAIDEWIVTHIAEGSKVVVAAHHRDVVSTIAEKYGNLKIQGGMKVSEVEEAKRRFQQWSPEEAPVIVVSILAGGEGHTLTAAQDILIVEEPWTPTDVDQVIARLHRIGQEGSVLATHMLAEGTIDLDLYDILADKRRVVEAATEWRRVAPTKSVGNLLVRLAGL